MKYALAVKHSKCKEALGCGHVTGAVCWQGLSSLCCLTTGCRTSLGLVPGHRSHAFSICNKPELETLPGVMQGQDMSKYRLICDKINGRLGPQYQYKM